MVRLNVEIILLLLKKLQKVNFVFVFYFRASVRLYLFTITAAKTCSRTSVIQKKSRFPNSGLPAVGDFNRLNTKCFQNSFDLKQIVKFPTRGDKKIGPCPNESERVLQGPHPTSSLRSIRSHVRRGTAKG